MIATYNLRGIDTTHDFADFCNQPSTYELHNQFVTTLQDCAFWHMPNLTMVDLPNCSMTGTSTFSDCQRLSQISFGYKGMHGNNLELTNCPSINSITLGWTSQTQRINISGVTTPYSLTLPYCELLSGYEILSTAGKIAGLYLLSSQVVSVGAYSSMLLSGTPFKTSSILGYFASIYVPSILYNAYCNDIYWSKYAARFVGM